MHTVHHTEAFILKSVPAGESNRRLWLFTREFGLVVAIVQGVRKQGAKLQMQLIDYSFVVVDLVKGKDVWRLISASTIDRVVDVSHKERSRVYIRTLSAVERFCHGEEPHHELFEHLIECARCTHDASIDAKSFDTVSLWRVMRMLGYSATEDERLEQAPLTEAIALLDDTTRKRLNKAINAIIESTHL